VTQAQTLMLSNDYTPIKVISWQRAIELLTLGKVEIIESYEGEVRSAYMVIKIPAVVRLLKRFRKHHKPVKFSRVNIYARDDYKCQYCMKRCTMNELTYDHVVPRSQGGKTEWTNIVSACAKCNGKKAGRTPEQAKMKLNKKPVQPTATPAVVIQISRTSIPDAWRDYLYWTGLLESDE
jgi:5-methylcytosine-specific restriction endonuclease McrA